MNDIGSRRCRSTPTSCAFVDWLRPLFLLSTLATHTRRVESESHVFDILAKKFDSTTIAAAARQQKTKKKTLEGDVDSAYLSLSLLHTHGSGGQVEDHQLSVVERIVVKVVGPEHCSLLCVLVCVGVLVTIGVDVCEDLKLLIYISQSTADIIEFDWAYG